METVKNGLPTGLLWLSGRAGLPGEGAAVGNVNGRDRADVLSGSIQAAGSVSARIRAAASHAQILCH